MVAKGKGERDNLGVSDSHTHTTVYNTVKQHRELFSIFCNNL